MKKIVCLLAVIFIIVGNISNVKAKEGDTCTDIEGNNWKSFVEDSKVKITLRNMYINRDNRETGKYAGSAEEWGQSFILDYESGYTKGDIGFGIDSFIRGVFRLSGDGKRGAINEERNPGQLFPVKETTGRAVHEYNAIDFIGKAKISETELKVGRGFRPRIPVLMSNDSRLIPQSFSGYALYSKDIGNVNIIAGQFNRVKGRVSQSWDKIAINGAKIGSSNLYFAGGDYKPLENLTFQYYFANLEDFYNQHFIGTKYDLPLNGYGKLKFDARYFYSYSDGQNSKNNRSLTGYTSRGYYGNGITEGEVDNQLGSVKINYELKGHDVGIGYQYSTGDSDLPHVSNATAYPGKIGMSTYVITQLFNHEFVRAGERSWVITYNYNFKEIGVDGLNVGMAYVSGRNVKTQSGNAKEWESNYYVSYTIPEGKFKGLEFMYKNSIYRGNIQDGFDENYFIVSYSKELY